jgi:HlyD family secretion protein
MIVGAGVFLVAAVLVAVNLRHEQGKKVPVEIEIVRTRNITSVVNASGAINPKRKVEVSASQIGTVDEVGVKEGDSVREGDFLLQIDPVPHRQSVERLRAAGSSARADLELALATLKQAEQEEERIRNLREVDLASPQDLLRVETEREVAAARVEAARGTLRQQEALLRNADHDLELTTIRAPMTGVVVELNVEAGETAIVGTMNNPGTVLLTIADLSELEAEVEVDETDVVDLALGMPARVSIDSYPDTTFGGIVTEIGNSAIRSLQASESVDFNVVITLSDPVPGAKPGLSATADIIVAERKSVLSVPMASLTIRRTGESENPEADELLDDDPTARKKSEEKEGVFLVRGKRAAFAPAVTGIVGERYFEVLSGVAEGDTVVSGTFEAIRDLEDGARVRIVEKREEEEKEKKRK